MARVIALAAALTGALLWAILAVMPPAPLGAGAPATAFSATRALADIKAMARAPHPVGSAENARVRGYLASRLRALGAEVSEQAVPLGSKSLQRLGKWSGREERGVVARNLIGVIPGKDRAKPAVLLMAHYDGVWGSPAAADDAMGVAAILEAARAMRARGVGERDLILLFTDSEEVGLDGADGFFKRHGLATYVGAIVNLETRGAGGRANMFETGPGNGAMMRLYAAKVARPATNSLAVLIYGLMPNSTDYTVAKAKGIPGFNLAVLDRGWAYHSPMATPDAVDPASVQDMGDQALALTSALAFASELPARAPDASFADLMGRVTIVYPAAAGWALLAVAALLTGLAWRRERPAPRAIGGGMIQVAALLLHGSLLLTAWNALSGSGGANYYDRLAALPRLETMAALLIAGLMAMLPLFRRREPRLLMIAPAMALMWAGLLTGGAVMIIPIALLAMLAAWFLPVAVEDRGWGALLLLLLSGLIVQIAQPTAGPFLHWPLLLAAIAFAARAWLPERAALAIAALMAAIGVGHLLAQAHFIMLGIGAEMPAVLALLLFVALPLLLPLWPARAPRWLPGTALAAALAIALWVRLDPIAPSIPAYSQAEGGTKHKD
ncbi:M20/M25/M40 family metallo-hydrolase [Rhizorhabdus dicambivorans]|uniref:Vacuolar membrane protease n=1 Tax=Rhizorhabdus dicambivorans TaxID=1850238 RepID=A0A2A4G276_9SPHN|nr:M20/M25/M40 family metallo-hydrolase [Rhizorhabdus dicambivorans]ATE66629.1 peptidase M28 [Rhizorhabdus dicambivorans]PCE43887.1 peptidase M28 [Rhizorhabdus dicambivorans]